MKVKFCKDCRFCSAPGDEWAQCTRTTYADHLSTGKWLTTGEGPTVIEHYNCVVERSSPTADSCGVEGKFFIPLSSAPVETNNNNPTPSTVSS